MAPTQSLRRTLAVRFAATMFVALGLVALWAYLGVGRQLRRQMDQMLVAAGHLAEASIAAGRLPAQLPDSLDFQEMVREVNRIIVVRDSAGRIVSANTRFGFELPLDSTGFETARRGGRGWSDQSWRQGRLRSVWLPVPPAGRLKGYAVIQVAASRAPVETEIRNVFDRMVMTLLLATLATFVGAGWLAGRAVRPVAEITREAAGIGPDVAGRRIATHADVAEFEGLVRVLNGMLDRLDQALRWQRKLIADLGHDLRTPITVLRASVELALQRDRSAAEYRDVLQSTQEEVERLALISEALLLLARYDAGGLVPHRTAVALDTLVDSAVDRARERSGERGFHAEVPPSVFVHVDRGMLALALDQLLDNTIRHTPQGTMVRVSAEEGESGVALVVEDSGAGLPDEALPRLFERFFRGDPARQRTAGAGLGLTIVAAVAQVHGGEAGADRSPLGGLRITLRLPRPAAEAAA